LKGTRKKVSDWFPCIEERTASPKGPWGVTVRQQVPRGVESQTAHECKKTENLWLGEAMEEKEPASAEDTKRNPKKWRNSRPSQTTTSIELQQEKTTHHEIETYGKSGIVKGTKRKRAAKISWHIAVGKTCTRKTCRVGTDCRGSEGKNSIAIGEASKWSLQQKTPGSAKTRLNHGKGEMDSLREPFIDKKKKH